LGKATRCGYLQSGLFDLLSLLKIPQSRITGQVFWPQKLKKKKLHSHINFIPELSHCHSWRRRGD
uniref:Uncharacterized protein n=1 Tax=Athene cunicularia TaxID=194338 RepID=A0A663NF10_ATHCN